MILRDISDVKVNTQLYTVFRKEFDFISGLREENYVLKYGSGKYGEFVYLKLIQQNSIYIDLCITECIVDLIIGKNTVPIFEMDKVIDDYEIKRFENLINKLLNKHIMEIEYDSGNIEFFDLESEEILFKKRNVFSFLWPKRVNDMWKYEPWIKK